MKQMLITFLIVLTATMGLVGQAQKQGKGWIRLNQNMIRSDSYFDADSDPVSIRTNSLYLTSLSGEYSITDRIAGTFSFPFFVRTTVNALEFNQSGTTQPGRALNSFGDSEMGIKYVLRKKLPVQAMLFLSLGLPLGKVGTVGTDTDIQTGDGEFNQLIGIQLHQNFSSFRIAGKVAFNNRSNDFSNDIHYGVEAGYVHSKMSVLIRFTAIESLFNDTAPVSLNSIFSNHREIFSPGAEVMYHFSKRMGAFASADFIVAGRNTLNAPFLGAGIQLKN